MRLSLWSVVEFIGFALVAVGVGVKADPAWGLIAGGVLLAVWAGLNELGGAK